MTAVIEILSGDLEGRAYDIDEAPFTIGRKDDCAIVLPKKYVSRRHAEIVEKGGRYLVRGLSEKNPITAGDREVKELALEDGQTFEICGIKFRFRARGKGANREDREKLRASAVVANAVGAPTQKYDRRTAGGDDIEDGPLPDEDTKAWDDKASGAAKGSGALAAPKQPSGSGPEWRPDPNEGPRERVVFGDDEPAPAAAAKKSHKGSGDDKEERTDQIDVSKFNRADDPFAEKKAERTPEELAAREKFIKTLVMLGLAGIACAGALVFWLNYNHGPPPVVEIDFRSPVAVGEVRRFDEPLNDKDPPEQRLATPLDGTALEGGPTADDPNVATVEWAIPDAKSTAFFLVRGVQPGETTFQLKFQSGAIRRYHVKVEGVSKHEVLKKARMDHLATLSTDELKREIHDRIRQGEELEKALLNQGPKQERYPRQALHDYELAEEALQALTRLIDKQGTADPDLDSERATVNTHLERARETWRQAQVQKRKAYEDLVRREQWDDASKELVGLLWLVGDDCDLDYQRYLLLLQKVYAPHGYKVTFEGTGCIEEQK